METFYLLFLIHNPYHMLNQKIKYEALYLLHIHYIFSACFVDYNHENDVNRI